MPLASVTPQQFYDQSPYPDPLNVLAGFRQVGPYAKDLNLYRRYFSLQPKNSYHILSLGCGTTQAAILALANPQAQITAIDISQETLKTAKTIANKLGLSDQIKFHQQDLQSDQSLPTEFKFDLIVVTGVLHHLPKAHMVLEKLKSHMTQDSLVHAMVYSECWVKMKKPIINHFQDQKIHSVSHLIDYLKSKGSSKIKKAIADLYGEFPAITEIWDSFLHYGEASWSVEQYLNFFKSAELNNHLFSLPPDKEPTYSADYHECLSSPQAVGQLIQRGRLRVIASLMCHRPCVHPAKVTWALNPHLKSMTNHRLIANLDNNQWEWLIKTDQFSLQDGVKMFGISSMAQLWSSMVIVPN